MAELPRRIIKVRELHHGRTAHERHIYMDRIV